MKTENEPVTEDEWLLRLVWEDRFVEREPPVSPNAFEPREGRNPDIDGISLFRESCLNHPVDALGVVAAEKRHRYGIVKIPVSMLAGLGLTVRPAPIAQVPGHVVIPELNIAAYKSDRSSFSPAKNELAEVASANIVTRPSAPDGE